ncbi:hypothetical protein [Planctomyces sp. SH-PL62]|uniref:hypothetical protein n=1 Tax=Planctomyces sp. SH-PL62 TaxID=1636152 RepID=UPI00078ED7DA|nr:hypothetical protein [Planctomyces sp. SH-PL62]AMV36556.1 hypothetical protein VT85_03930 [Planctomyces sp. SH-PL62]
MSVPSKIDVRYECPHCRVELEAILGRWRGWLLCPACGKPGLPPSPGFAPPTPGDAGGLAMGAGVQAAAWIASGDLRDPARPAWPARPVDPRRRLSPAARNVRRAAVAGLAVSLFLLLIAFLDQNARLAGAAGVLTLIMLWFLGRLDPRRAGSGR